MTFRLEIVDEVREWRRPGQRIDPAQPEGTATRLDRYHSTGTSAVRILFVFDPARNAVLLVAGDKAGNWRRWYREAIATAQARYHTYLKEREP